jgi:hypothetical protein
MKDLYDLIAEYQEIKVIFSYNKFLKLFFLKFNNL